MHTLVTGIHENCNCFLKVHIYLRILLRRASRKFNIGGLVIQAIAMAYYYTAGHQRRNFLIRGTSLFKALYKGINFPAALRCRSASTNGRPKTFPSSRQSCTSQLLLPPPKAYKQSHSFFIPDRGRKSSRI